MLKKMFTLVLSLFIFFNLGHAAEDTDQRVNEFFQNLGDFLAYLLFIKSDTFKKKLITNNVDAFALLKVHEMYVLSKVFSCGSFCVLSIKPQLKNLEESINSVLDKDLSRVLNAMCDFLKLSDTDPANSFGVLMGKGVLPAPPYTLYFNRGIIVRFDIFSNIKITITPADPDKHISLFSQKFTDPQKFSDPDKDPDKFSQLITDPNRYVSLLSQNFTDYTSLFDQEFIVSIQIEPGLKAMYKTHPFFGIVEILDISSIVDIKRNFVSLSNITYKELVLFLLEYYRETIKEKRIHSSLTFITNFMTSLIEQEKFVTWLTQKYSNQLMGVKKSKDEKDIKTQKRKGVK